ncbi:hypothetical protein SL103_07255 [Streptomyces lydicus]|uniref:Uncharacterized protein n=1 Tax=Streptomyces lydicus TaxID=47763 RepID=A0A1D7VH24_9ACTN|nr:hypothetical protein SL103_07255 [Streptomyces lydicus]
MTVQPTISALALNQGEAAEAEGLLLTEPTGAATVRFSLAPVGMEVSASVPEKWSGDSLRTLHYLGATAASTIGPVALLTVTAGTSVPWGAAVGLGLLLILMPLAYVLLSNRQSKG